MRDKSYKEIQTYIYINIDTPAKKYRNRLTEKESIKMKKKLQNKIKKMYFVSAYTCICL